MKRIIGMFVATCVAATLGCSTDKPFTGDKYAADKAVEISPGRMEIAEQPLAPAMSRVNPDEIDEDNYSDAARRLESDVRRDRGAMSKVGK